MKILHYSLGFPPYRSGGLTKFCIDCMREQQKQGHTVAMIWPGQIKIFSKINNILDRGQVNINSDSFQSYEIINPLPVPYDEGIDSIKLFMEYGDLDSYKKVFKIYCPDVIHIHTFMGLHKAFIDAAKELGIRLVFTTHDFFPICPKVTLFRDGAVCSDADKCLSCADCNTTALSIKKMIILQSPFYRILKDNKLVKKFRSQHRNNYLSSNNTSVMKNNNLSCNDYKQLRDYYKKMFVEIDYIHYNSSIAKEIYDKYFGTHAGEIISITHSEIKNNWKKKEFGDQLQISYLGTPSSAKGFYYLKDTLDELWKINDNFRLHIYFSINNPSEYMIMHDRYNYNDLYKVMDKSDVVVVPSIWYETFGFTALEAISYGTPVIITSNVGAKDILDIDSSIILENKNDLYNIINDLDKNKLETMNLNIFKNIDILKMDKFLSMLEKCYQK